MTKEYTFSATITISATTKVEAESYEEALAEAQGREPELIISQGEIDEDWIVGEIDGEPSNIRLDEEL